MEIIQIVELIPGYKTKVDSTTVLNTEIPEHKEFLNKLTEEALSNAAIAEQVEGKEYYFRIKPIEIELLIK